MPSSTASGPPIRLGVALALTLLSACGATPPEAPAIGQAASGHVSYAMGYTRLASGWDGARDQWTYGAIDADWRPEGWPLWLTSQFLLSYSSDVPDSAPAFADSSGAYEISLGVRRYTAVGRAEPWIGAGVALLGGSVLDSYSSGGWYWTDDLADDLALGWYADAGVRVALTPLFTLGLAVRWSEGGDLDLFGEDVRSGGLSVLALIGSRF